MRFKIDCASLIVGSKFTVFALFCFVFKGNSPRQAPGGLIFGGGVNGCFFAFPVYIWRLIFGGAYTWRGLFSEFYAILTVDESSRALDFSLLS